MCGPCAFPTRTGAVFVWADSRGFVLKNENEKARYASNKAKKLKIKKGQQEDATRAIALAAPLRLSAVRASLRDSPRNPPPGSSALASRPPDRALFPPPRTSGAWGWGSYLGRRRRSLSARVGALPRVGARRALPRPPAVPARCLRARRSCHLPGGCIEEGFLKGASERPGSYPAGFSMVLHPVNQNGAADTSPPYSPSSPPNSSYQSFTPSRGVNA